MTYQLDSSDKDLLIVTSQLFIHKKDVASASTEGEEKSKKDQVEGAGKVDQKRSQEQYKVDGEAREWRDGDEKDVVAVRTLRRQKNSSSIQGVTRRHSVI